MVAIAKRMFPEIRFRQGDAHDLPFEDGSFDRVLMNFGLLHVSHPEKACAEACRVLKRGGKFGFTVWAGPEQNPGAKIVNDAIEAYANLNVGLPEGPPKYLYGEREECRQVLERVGFDGASMSYETRTVEWHHPDAGYYFEAERNAGVRTAGILARQSPETLESDSHRALKTESNNTREETNSFYRWRRMWLWCRRTRLFTAGAVAAALWAARTLRTAKRLQDGTTQSRRRSSSPRQPCNQNSDRRS